MERRTSSLKTPASAVAIEQVLESRYEQLLKWSELLTRGDRGAAREIVHDLCLYFALTKPDFSGIANLDGYLYTCLRHTYLSRLERSSREALRFVSIEDYDSIQLAFAGSVSGISLDIQNDLRNICGYAVWRKDSSKSFSYFILHFFHGYFPREIAGIACLPIAAIYNKLKTSRAELKSYLAAPRVLSITGRETPPAPIQLRAPVSSAELFRELRETVLRAPKTECLPEEELLSHYGASLPSPISCSLLSHIVSCERCLGLVDRHFRRPTLKDRDSLDGFDRALNMNGAGEKGRDKANMQAMLASVRRRRDRLYEHRPEMLSIAVNGRIAAFHDVQGEQSVLSARIDNRESARFVEVFSEQNIRLALLPVGELPPQGSHTLTQHTSLSDGRWLELNLMFDGLGLQGEVVYFDPALALAPQQEPEEVRPLAGQYASDLSSEAPQARRAARLGWIARLFSVVKPSPALAWSIVSACFLLGGAYLAYLHHAAPMNGEAILNRSVSLEAAGLQGNTEHQILQLEETLATGHTVNGTVDLWRDSNNGEYMRRLYDKHHRLIAAVWRGKDGASGSYRIRGNAGVSDEDRRLAANDLWKQDLSSRAFRALAGHELQVKAFHGGYELSSTAAAGNRLQLVSAVLVLDRGLDPASELLRLRGESGLQQVRYVQTKRERRPSSGVPDAVFAPTGMDPNTSEEQEGSPGSSPIRPATVSQLVQLEISALYRLHQLGADIGEPIEISRTPDACILVDGTVPDDARKAEIVSALETLPDRRLLRIRLISQKNARMPTPGAAQIISPSTSVYSVAQLQAPAEEILVEYFATTGLTGKPAKAAAMQFSQEALEHAQRALQQAYALDRLGKDFTSDELQEVNPAIQREWVEMTAEHALTLEHELRALDDQLRKIPSVESTSPPSESEPLTIDSPADFAQAADLLLRATQRLNRDIGSAFASGVSEEANHDPHLLIADAANSIPLHAAAAMADFAARLGAPQGAKDARRSFQGRTPRDRAR